MPLDKAMMMEDEVLTPKGRRMLEMNAKNLELNTWKPGTMILKVIQTKRNNNFQNPDALNHYSDFC